MRPFIPIILIMAFAAVAAAAWATLPASAWPSDVVGWTSVVANLVTIFGGGWLVVNVSLKLSAMLHLQHAATAASEASYRLQSQQFLATERPRDAPDLILSTWLRHAETERYFEGVTGEQLAQLNAEQREDYGLFVSRMIAAFDLILEDAPHARDPQYMQGIVQPRLRSELRKHIAALGRWPWQRARLPTGPLLRQIIKEVVEKGA